MKFYISKEDGSCLNLYHIITIRPKSKEFNNESNLYTVWLQNGEQLVIDEQAYNEIKEMISMSGKGSGGQITRI